MAESIISRKKSLFKKQNVDLKALLFYVAMIALPLIQFVIFYVVANFNSILLSFKAYDMQEGKWVGSWVGFDNFILIGKQFQMSGLLWTCVKNSLYVTAIDFLVVLPLSLIFAYYIFRKYPLAGFFKVMLFIPSVICSMILVIFFMSFGEGVLKDWLNNTFGKDISSIFGEQETGIVLFTIFYIWNTFSASILLYINAFSNVDNSLIEASKVDGSSELSTFFHVMIPGIWKTIVSLTVISISAFAVNQFYVYSFLRWGAEGWAQTLGYYQFCLIAKNNTMQDYPLASAYGLLFTAITLPVVFLFRWAMNKFGPKEN